MKKLIMLLLLSQYSNITAQKETVVSPYGKKITINTNSLNTADNGLTASTAKNVQLGGALIKATTLETDPLNILEIQKDAPGALQITDGTEKAGYRLTSDANGVATWKPDYLSLHARYTTPQIKLTANINNILTLINNPTAERAELSTAYVAPLKGAYLVTVSGGLYLTPKLTMPVMRSLNFNCMINGSYPIYWDQNKLQAYSSDFFEINSSKIIELKQGDKLTFAIEPNTDDLSTQYKYMSIDVIFIGY